MRPRVCRCGIEEEDGGWSFGVRERDVRERLSVAVGVELLRIPRLSHLLRFLHTVLPRFLAGIHPPSPALVVGGPHLV